MFRCKECGTEFDVKPDYCDCGNDTFDEIVEQVGTPQEVALPKENPFKVEEKKVVVEPVKEEKFERVENAPKKEKKQEPLIVFERPNLPQIKIEPISLTIFLICIILSFVVIFFVGNTDSNVQAKKEVEQQTINNNIPNIDKIWDSTKPTTQSVVEMRNQEETVAEQEPVLVAQPDVQKTVPKQTTKKNNAVTLPMYQPSKHVNVGKTQSKIQTKTQPKTVAKPQQTSTSTQKSKAQITAKTSTAPKTTTAVSANPQEMAYYKISLRNKIASKIDFTNILGDGTCVVTFKVSSSGQLTNRAFARQSDNGMLNDEVYKAVMSTPTFKAPPTGYNGGTMRLTVKIYGGQFEVSLN